METFSTLLALCAETSLVTGEFPAQRLVTWSFDVFFDLRLNKRLSKQSWGWWFERPSQPSRRHYNDGNLSISRVLFSCCFPVSHLAVSSTLELSIVELGCLTCFYFVLNNFTENIYLYREPKTLLFSVILLYKFKKNRKATFERNDHTHHFQTRV